MATLVDDGTYDRDLFPHWIESGGCSTRESVLKRDGTSVTVGSDCYPTSGSWKSPYDGATWTAPSDVDIDHMVPLKNAWVVSLISLTELLLNVLCEGTKLTLCILSPVHQNGQPLDVKISPMILRDHSYGP